MPRPICIKKDINYTLNLQNIQKEHLSTFKNYKFKYEYLNHSDAIIKKYKSNVSDGILKNKEWFDSPKDICRNMQQRWVISSSSN